MEKNKYLFLGFIFVLLLLNPKNVFADAKCSTNGIDASKWQYSNTVKATADDVKNNSVFHDLGSSGKICCQFGYAGQTIQYRCDIYTLIDPSQSTTDSKRFYDKENAITCQDEYSLENYTYDYSEYASDDLQDQTSETTVCCQEVQYNSRNYLCSFYAANKIIEEDGYEAGGSVSESTEDETEEREDLEDITGDTAANCNAIFDEEARELIERLFQIVCIAAPILLIVLGSVDFGNAVLSSDKEALQKAVKRFTTRCIVAVAIFFLPMLVDLIFHFPGMDIIEGIVFCDV